jgi:hypothetical protein
MRRGALRDIRFAVSFVTILASSLPVHASRAQDGGDGEVEHRAVLEAGAAFAWDLGEQTNQYGGTLAVEVTPIEDWLELEFGLSAVTAHGRTEESADLLFKKPYRLSPKSEFMIGLGPELVRSGRRTSWGAEAVLDFMLWPRRDVGWYVEPGYEVVFRRGTGHAFNLAAGLLIGWR